MAGYTSYSPPMSLSQTMTFLNSTGLFKNEKPIELGDAIKEANEVEKSQYEADKLEREEQFRQEFEANSIDEFGNVRPMEEILEQARQAAVEVGDVDRFIKVEEQIQNNINKKNQDFDRMLRTNITLGGLSPEAAARQWNENPELRAIEEMNPYKYTAMKSRGRGSGASSKIANVVAVDPDTGDSETLNTNDPIDRERYKELKSNGYVFYNTQGQADKKLEKIQRMGGPGALEESEDDGEGWLSRNLGGLWEGAKGIANSRFGDEVDNVINTLAGAQQQAPQSPRRDAIDAYKARKRAERGGQ